MLDLRRRRQSGVSASDEERFALGGIWSIVRPRAPPHRGEETVQTDVVEAGPFERMLTLHLEEAELENAKNAAARKLSRQLKIKGFRPGKAPRAIVERMVGAETLRSEALEDSLPGLVGSALEEMELDPVTTPQISDVRDADGGGVQVDVKITLWPTVDHVPDLVRTIEVELPEVEETELQEQIDRARSQYAELEDVAREANEGDFVMVNVSALHGGAILEDVTANDLLYEVGSRSFIPGLDDLVTGVTAGTIKEGPAVLPEGFREHAGEEVTLRVLVKGVKQKKLPELTDDWVSDVSEFETVDELTGQLRDSLMAMKLNVTRNAYRDKLLGELIAELDVELPEALVEAELESSLHNLVHSLQAQGLDLATYLAVTGQDQRAFVDDLRGGADRSLRTRILLEGVARDLGIEVEESEIDAALDDMARSSGRDRTELRDMLIANGQDSVLAGDILRRKALDRILEASTPVDAAGNPVDLRLRADDEEEDLDEAAPDASSVGDQDAGPDADEDA
jgi:trigger factor